MPVAGSARSSFVAKLPERADDPRLDQLELAEQVVLAVVDLLRQRIAVAGRPAFQDVGTKTSGARQPDLAEQLCPAACPAWPTNGTPCLSSLAPGGLADEHQVGVGVAGAEDHGLAGRGELRAARARRRLPVDGLQLLAAFLRAGHRPSVAPPAARDDRRDSARCGVSWSARPSPHWDGPRRPQPHPNSQPVSHARTGLDRLRVNP